MDKEPAAPAASPPPTTAAAPPTIDADAARINRARFQAKVAGAMMMLFGALFAFQFGYGAYAGSQHATWDQQPGGDIRVEAGQANATVTLAYANGTALHFSTAANGTVQVHSPRAAVQVTVLVGNATYVRNAIIPQYNVLAITIVADSPATATVGIDPSMYQTLWLFALAPALVAVGGYFAFKLRAPRLALAGAFVFLAGSAYVLVGIGFDLLNLSLVGTGALCFFFIYRARAVFSPLRSKAV